MLHLHFRDAPPSRGAKIHPPTMKKIALLSTVALLSLGAIVRADSPQTLKGEAVCAKCELHQTDTCQNAIRVTKDGKTEVILCDANAVSKGFHKTICHGPANVTAEGTITEKDGKKTIALTKIEEAK
jgi:hypothetical protein